MWDLSLGTNFVGIGPEVFFSSPSLLLPSSFGSAYLWKKWVVHLQNFGLTKNRWGALPSCGHTCTTTPSSPSPSFFLPTWWFSIRNSTKAGVYSEKYELGYVQLLLGEKLGRSWRSYSILSSSVIQTRKWGDMLNYKAPINNSVRPEDALAVQKRYLLTDNLKSRDASASKKIPGRQAADQQSGWALALASSFLASTRNHCHSSS